VIVTFKILSPGKSDLPDDPMPKRQRFSGNSLRDSNVEAG